MSTTRDRFKQSNRAPNKPNKKDEYNIIECYLYKENIDTIQAVNLIAKHLRINQKRIGFAGTKDKRAFTTQLISLFK